MSKEKNTMEPAAGKNALPLGLRQNNPLKNNTSLYFAYVLARLIRKLDLYKVKDFTLPEPTMENADVYICLVHAMAVVENGKKFEDLIADGEIRMAYEMLFQR